MKTKTIKQTVIFEATPEEVYEMYMDSKKHSKFTGSKATISRNVGGSFSAYEGSLNGKNIELIPNKKIVQDWQCIMEGWPVDHASKVTIKLEKTKTGTKLVMVHSGVPESTARDIESGWKEFYWEPIKAMLDNGKKK